MTDLEAAWDELHGVKPDGWFVGPPTHEEHRHEWTMREMARCLRLISEGTAPV